MNNREDSFFRRFKSAQISLGIQEIKNLVSFKYRDDSVVPSEYSHFVDDYLRRMLDLKVLRLDGDFGGQAWLVTDKSHNKLILVEHETGLEILYVLGSLASLIALLPLVSSSWIKLRQRFSRHTFESPSMNGVEIRQFNQNNALIEKQAPSAEIYVLDAMLQDHLLLKEKVSKLEAEIESLRKTDSLRKRGRNTRLTTKKSKRKK